MPKLTRAEQKVFGSTAPSGQISRFGSLAAGSPAFTTDPVNLQSLSNYLQGWFGAVIGNNSPAIEDMNALHYLITRQLAYLFQQGVPEWNSTTTYYNGSIVLYNDGSISPDFPGYLYQCNFVPGASGDPCPVGTVPTNASYWKPLIEQNNHFLTISNSATRIFDGRSAAAINEWNGVAHVPFAGFVAVGENIASPSVTNKAMTSLDGITWTSRTTPAGNQQWFALTSGFGRIVAVAYGGSGNKVMYSNDYGITWTLTPASNNSLSWKGVAYSQPLGMFVAVSESGTTDGVMTSSDGITWTARTIPANYKLRSVIWSSKLSRFVAAGSELVSSSERPRILTSTNGTTWTVAYNSNTVIGQPNCMAEDPSINGVGGVRVAGQSSPGWSLDMTSEDGTLWSVDSPSQVGSVTSMAYSPEHKTITGCVSGSSGYRLARRFNGSGWKLSKTDEAFYVSVAYNPTDTIFAAVGVTGTNRVATSR